MKATPGLIALTFAAASILSAAAGADTLILKDGSRVETKGAWEVRGAVVVFHLPNGALASLRASEIDLEASGRSPTGPSGAEVEEPMDRSVSEPQVAPVDPSRPAPAPPVPPSAPASEPERGGPTAAPTDQIVDVPVPEAEGLEVEAPRPDPEIRATPNGPPRSETGSAAEIPVATNPVPERAPTPTPASEPEPATGTTSELRFGEDEAALQVVAWEETGGSESGGSRIQGMLQNDTRHQVSAIRLTVLLYDDAGNSLGAATARIGANALKPGRGTPFVVDFPGVPSYASVRFQTDHIAIETRPSSARPTD